MEEKADSELVRLQNRRNVIAALRQRGRLARIDLGRITGLSPASITTISAQLIEERVVEELPDPMGIVSTVKRGRPTVKLGLRPQAAYVVGGKISIEGIELVLADYGGNVLHTKTKHIATYQSEQREFGLTVAREIRDFIAAAGLNTKDVARIGFAVQGLPDIRDGSIDWSPAFREQNIPLAEPIEDELGIALFVANDANMIAEGLIGGDPQRYAGNLAAIFIGYGVGMGLIIDGQVYHGATGTAAEFGHMNHIPHGAMCRCGRKGCLEAYIADYSILRHANGEDENLPAPMSAVSADDMHALMQRASRGEAQALRAYARAGEALGFGIARLIALINPESVVIAGPGTVAQEYLEPAMRQAILDGVAAPLARDVSISFVAINQDMIMRGTIGAILRLVDREVTAVRSGAALAVVA
jgi:predicted NBD/HSP70 family sugar kinase